MSLQRQSFTSLHLPTYKKILTSMLRGFGAQSAISLSGNLDTHPCTRMRFHISLKFIMCMQTCVFLFIMKCVVCHGVYTADKCSCVVLFIFNVSSTTEVKRSNLLPVLASITAVVILNKKDEFVVD